MSAIASLHRPVLLREALDGLAIQPDGHIVDCTFGRGGHSRAILERLGDQGRLLALDKDPDAVKSGAAEELSTDSRLTLRHGSFARLEEFVEQLGWTGRVSGVLMDLGVSSPQLDEAGRGFSFTRSGPLDMRMDTSQGLTAAEWLAGVSENDLARVIGDFGEERFARRIARAIVAHRVTKPLETTGDLAGLIERAVPTREKGKHPATRSFQAIRIFINHELGELEQGLRQTLDVLCPGGRMAVISFHSLEDRIVKRFMRDEARGGGPDDLRWPAPPARMARLDRPARAVMPGEGEVSGNPRARSAVLRVAGRLSA
ncbi:16S rRNA (cytosine(1402)-N(4))-methyltransferase RsmH [Methylomagnum sp.]